MKPLRNRLQEARKRLGIPWEVLERDYVLSWILAGVSRVDGLRDTLIFKGGTALKKCFFGNYRFSEDLDFSGDFACPAQDVLQDGNRREDRVTRGRYSHETGCQRHQGRIGVEDADNIFRPHPYRPGSQNHDTFGDSQCQPAGLLRPFGLIRSQVLPGQYARTHAQPHHGRHHKHDNHPGNTHAGNGGRS
ncbi:MAG: nucleotidyl transferase AbiEii/AbiGii toxin family protein [Deltaproteobacteria bacterium]|nr:nucleotidyl transferase AbiEii/AbiGii toxin family protein [Deltaproteobacteria bacterium]